MVTEEFTGTVKEVWFLPQTVGTTITGGTSERIIGTLLCDHDVGNLSIPPHTM
jgi:hypothetical protein